VAISNARFRECEGLMELNIEVWNWGVSPSLDIVIRPTFHWHDSDIDDEMNRFGGKKISFPAPLSPDETVEIQLKLPDGFTVENGYRSYVHFLLDCHTSQFWLWRRKNRLRQAFELFEGEWEEVQGGVLRFAISSAKVRARMKSRRIARSQDK